MMLVLIIAIAALLIIGASTLVLVRGRAERADAVSELKRCVARES